jgi:tetratricopeptide (TPR) repeat protein
MRRALEEFQRAIQIDPQYASAHAGVADALSLTMSYNLQPSREVLPKAEESARMALQLDDSLAEARISLASVLHNRALRAEAEAEFKRGIELNPGYATAHHWFALHLAAQGRTEEALSEIRRAQELDPLSLIISANQAWCLYLGHRFEEAITQARKAISLDANFSVAHGYLGQALAARKNFDEAIAEMQRAVELSGGNVSYRAELASIYGLAGRAAEARGILEEILRDAKERYVSPYDIAVIYVGLGDTDNAFRYLDAAFEERNVRLVNLGVHPFFDSLRNDHRFRSLLRRLGLPTE